MERRDWPASSSWKDKLNQERSVHIGQKIRQMREERGLSLTVLAARAGIAKSYLSNIERRVQSNPSMLFLEKVSRVFQVEVESLVTDVNVPLAVDPDWVDLVQEAIEAGMSKEEFRTFIEYKKFMNWSNGQEP
jgi:XRE family transcriptional regulator, master regulator for biofilm formation